MRDNIIIISKGKFNIWYKFRYKKIIKGFLLMFVLEINVSIIRFLFKLTLFVNNFYLIKLFAKSFYLAKLFIKSFF